MSGYRSRAVPRPGRPEGDNLVEGMVKQFADPFAFLRELVQNAIDASATKITVDVDSDAHGRAIVSVEDDGEGMTLAIVEGPLLTLFSTSKEGQDGKIGKYGVGFMSVFAIEPTEVWIETHRSEGHLFVRLQRDHSYTIEDRPVREGHGTKVSLVLGNDREPSELRETVLSALRRYCRHVRCEVVLSGPESAIKIGEPLSIDAPISASIEKDGFHVVVGYSAGTPLLGVTPLEGVGDYAGFFNRGLTLFESFAEEQVERGVRFKIDSARLGHTLSRDTVRKDAELARGMSIVRNLVSDELDRVLEEALREEVKGGALEVRGVALLRCAAEHLKPKRIHVPLLAPIGDRCALPLAEVASLSPKGEPLLVGSDSDEIARDLATEGVPIIRSSVCDPLLGALVGRAVVSVGEHFDLLRPLTMTPPHGEHFARALGGLLARGGIELEGVVLGSIQGTPLVRALLVAGRRPRYRSTKSEQSGRRKPESGDALFLDVNDTFYGQAIARYEDESLVVRAEVLALAARCVTLDLGLRLHERSRAAMFLGVES